MGEVDKCLEYLPDETLLEKYVICGDAGLMFLNALLEDTF